MPDAFDQATIDSQQFLIDNIDQSAQTIRAEQITRFVTRTPTGAQTPVHTVVRNAGVFTVGPGAERIGSVNLVAPRAAFGLRFHPGVQLQTSVRFTNISSSSVVGTFISPVNGLGL